MKYKYAIVRPPGKSYKEAISSTNQNHQIDIEKAQFQHEKYCEALEKVGLKVIKLPVNEEYPDSCFVQDPCVIFGNKAIMTILGADIRKGEGLEIEKIIKSFKEVKSMSNPATMDGGDVMITPSQIFIGLSKRTNLKGIAQYKKLFNSESLPQVTTIPVENCLHLMTGVTYLGKNTLVISNLIDDLCFKEFNKIYVSDEDAANCLGIGNWVIMPQGHPLVAKQIKKHGFKVLEVDISEFKKADGGVTCLSLLF